MDKNGITMPVPMNPMEALPFVDRSKLVTGAYTDITAGFAALPDGTGYVSDVNILPKVTAEMIHWYFTWRGLDPANYAATGAGRHISAQTMQTAKSKDDDLWDYEKYWDTTQTVVTLGEMGPATRYENFKCPSDVGFPFDFEAEKAPELICIRGYHEGEPPAASPDYFVCHQILDEKGVPRMVLKGGLSGNGQSGLAEVDYCTGEGRRDGHDDGGCPDSGLRCAAAGIYVEV